MPTGAISHDMFPLDMQYPAKIVPISFMSHGQLLLGRVFVAQGAGLHPTILLLHGFPGDEQNGDLAHAFRRSGWNVMVFHYRGMWGSGGSFSFTHTFEDIPVALELLKTREMREQCRIDPEKIVLIGHSLGGFAALFTAAHDPSIQAAASLAGFHFGRFAQTLQQDSSLIASTQRDWSIYLPVLPGVTTEQLVQEVLKNSRQWTLDQHLDTLAKRSIFVIGAKRDVPAPLELHHYPIVAGLEQRSAPRFRSAILNTDHIFSDARVALTQHLLDWLDDLQ